MVNLNQSEQIDYAEKAIKVIRAYQNKSKSQIIHLLYIYYELSTRDLEKLLKKSKPTILRNIEELIELGLVEVREETSPGKYDKRIYKIRSSGHKVAGNKLKDPLLENPEGALLYNNFQLNNYANLKSIVDSTIDYLEKMRIELEKKLDNPAELLKILRDGLGTLHYTYLKSESVKNFVKGGKGDINEIKKEQVTNKDQPNEYVYIQLLLPIRRMIEIQNSSEWFPDGNLWWYEDRDL